MFDMLKKYLGAKLTWVKCGGFKCTNVFQVKEGEGKPEIYICKSCQYRIDEGIVAFVHAGSGKLKGNFHIMDGYSKN
jgi:hypothetical protein